MKQKRTRDEIINDVSFVLGLDLHHGTKLSVLDGAVWEWTVMDGKLDGCKFWTREALAVKNDKPKLTHEHAVPRKVLHAKFFSLSRPSPEVIGGIFRRFCVGVVVTRDQDKILDQHGLRSSMPPGWGWDDPWARYRVAGIFEDVVEPKK